MDNKQAEISLIVEAIEDKITCEYGDKIIPRILNDLREHGKDYVRNVTRY